MLTPKTILHYNVTTEPQFNTCGGDDVFGLMEDFNPITYGGALNNSETKMPNSTAAHGSFCLLMGADYNQNSFAKPNVEHTSGGAEMAADKYTSTAQGITPLPLKAFTNPDKESHLLQRAT